MKDNSQSHRGRIAVNILFLAVIFTVFMGAIEILLRTTHMFGARMSWAEPDPIIGFKMTPGKKYWFKKENDHPITGKINSYGFRDKEWSLKKPQNTYRIAVLGDSFVEALQVESERTFLALAENELNKIRYQGPKFELMNFGRSGYTQSQELLVLKNDVEKFSPDGVLLFFLPGNDIDDIRRETSSSIFSPFYSISESGELKLDTSFSDTSGFKIRSYINWFKQRSALISLIGERYNAFKKQRRLRAIRKSEVKNPNGLPDRINGYLSLGTTEPDATYRENYKLNKILIKAMSEYCKEKGIRFMLVALDIPAHIPEVENKLTAIDPTFDANYFEYDLREYAKLLNIEYLGLQRVFKQSYETTGVFLHWSGGDGHWNYKGHEVVANTLVKKLQQIISLKHGEVKNE